MRIEEELNGLRLFVKTVQIVLGIQAMSDDRLDARRHGTVPATEPGWRLLPIGRDGGKYLAHGNIRHGERPSARQHFVENYAQRIEVATGVHGAGGALKCFQMLR